MVEIVHDNGFPRFAAAIREIIAQIGEAVVGANLLYQRLQALPVVAATLVINLVIQRYEFGMLFLDIGHNFPLELAS